MPSLARLQRFLPLTSQCLAPKHTVDLGRSVAMPPGYHPTNPALVRYEDGYFACVRGVNYVYESARYLEPIFTAGRGYHSVNRFLLLDAALNVRRRLEALDGYLDNVEDIRLFEHQGRIYGLGTKPLDSDGQASRMCLLEFDRTLSDVSQNSLESPYGFSREKNWCPFSHADGIGFLYACDPNVVVRLEPSENTPRFVAPAPEPAHLRFFDCGSTPGQRYADGQLFVTHRRSVQLPSLQRVYSSRMVWLSPDLQHVSYGPYFSIGPRTIQFISGFQLEGADVLLAYGVMDQRALISRFDRAAFRRLLPRPQVGQR